MPSPVKASAMNTSGGQASRSCPSASWIVSGVPRPLLVITPMTGLLKAVEKPGGKRVPRLVGRLHEDVSTE